MKDLIKKQEKMITEDLYIYLDRFITIARNNGMTNREMYSSLENIENLFKKARKETAEAVTEKMIGKPYLREHPFSEQLIEDNIGYNRRIKEEKEIKKQIIESL